MIYIAICTKHRKGAFAMMTAKLFEDAVQSATVESVHADYTLQEI